MPTLILLRHGQSQWNLENRFTGWTDVPLTDRGQDEARRAGRLLREEGVTFKLAVTSMLRRAIHTLSLVLEEMQLEWVPVEHCWRLNERHYGALQGLSKADLAADIGLQEVFNLRRGFDVRPPLLSRDDPAHPRFDPRYAGVDPALLPAGESLRDTLERVRWCWEHEIAPHLQGGRPVLVVAHGNSLRALAKFFEGVPDEKISEVYIPTGIPLVYEFGQGIEVRSTRFLGNPAEVQAAIAAGKILPDS